MPERNPSAGQSGSARFSGEDAEQLTLPGIGHWPSGTDRRALPGSEVTAGHRTERRSGTAGRALPGVPSREDAAVTARGRGSRVRVAGDLYHGRVPDGAVYVGRGAPGLPGSRYANRHRAGHCRVCGVEHDRAAAVAAYARDLEQRPELVDAARRELAGADLACWCRVDGGPCHGDVLALVVVGHAPQTAAAAVLG
ncbi:DUF4326 domain-containing protein [Micromonospora parva]|uniref:DUF4326 domain-containing protein n=1 Tax=Micromonospora parva TaxID=1464048 RepID=UPI00366E6D6E